MPKAKTEVLAPAVAGAGSGTGIIGLANAIFPNSEPLHSILIYSAPAVAVLASIGWTLIKSALLEWLARRDLERVLRRIRKIRDDVFADANATNAHKNAIQGRVERIEILLTEMMSDDSVALHAKLKTIIGE